MNRREILKYMASCGMLLMTSGIGSISAKSESFPQSISKKTLLEVRRKARFRNRRIIMNNDGNDSMIAESGNITIEQFLEKRTSGLIDSQVDTIFYCDGVNNIYSHTSNLTEYPVGNPLAMNTINSFKKLNTDPLSIIIDFCKKQNKEIFWSMRMNDNHDAKKSSLLSQFKKNHPEYLVGKEEVKLPVMGGKWSPYDYGHEAIRKLTVDTFKDVVSRYDVDGIELDFFRHPAFFKAQFYGEPVTQKDCDKMSQMVRDIRNVCDSIALKRNKPILMAIRIPDSFEYCKAIGLDVELWLKEELIDIITGADYFKLRPWEYLVDIGKEYNVPVYACLEQRRMSEEKDKPEKESLIKIWRGEAYMAWEAGVNGIYTFNRFNPKDQIFREIGDKKILGTLPMEKQVSYAGNSGYTNPGYWLKGGKEYIKK